MEMNYYQNLAEITNRYKEEMSRYKEGMNSEHIHMLLLGLCGESGELADYMKKVLHHDHELSHYKIREELGDVLWYVAALCSFFNLSLDDVARENIQKLRKRYPGGFSSDASIHRVV